MGLSSARAAFILVLMTSRLPVVTSDPDFPPAQADILDTEGVSVLADPVDSFNRGDSEAYDSDLGSSERLDKLYGMLGLIHGAIVALRQTREQVKEAQKTDSDKRDQLGPGPINHFLRIGRNGAGSDVTNHDVSPFSGLPEYVDSDDKATSDAYGTVGAYGLNDPRHSYSQDVYKAYAPLSDYDKGFSSLYNSFPYDGDASNGFAQRVKMYDQPGYQTPGRYYLHPPKDGFVRYSQAAPSSDYFTRSTRVFRTPYNNFVRIGRASSSSPFASFVQKRTPFSPMNSFVRIGRSLPAGFLATKRQMNKFVRIGRRSANAGELQEQILGLNSPGFVKITRGDSMNKGKRQALFVNPEKIVRISRGADTDETQERSRYLRQVVRMQPRAYVRIGRLPASVFLHLQDGGDDDGATGRRTSHFRLTSSSVTRAGKRTAQ